MIRWPDKYKPERTSVHVRNDLEIPVALDIVWDWLIRANLWPSWYSNSANVVIEGGESELKLGTKFKWTTFGVRLDSQVEEFVPYERIAWGARGLGINAYHAWFLEKRVAGCYVLTEENQNGFLARLSNILRPQNMRRQHQNWLNGLLSKAKQGPPPSSSS
jgi:hypothetical protein